MEDWKEYKLEEVCENIYSGGTPSTTSKEFWNGDFPWLSSGETGQNYIYSTEKTITQLGADNSSTRYAYKYSTVVASAGQGYTRGQASFLMIDTYVNQSVIVLKPNPKIIDSRFLYFNIDNRYAELRQLSDGTSTRGSLSGKIMKDLTINLPPLPTQQKIAQILSSLDDKIELNNKINANLEQQAQALFKSWFVDFEPFGGEELVESPINSMIPKSLKMIQIADIPHVLETGKRPKGGAVTEGIPSIGAENVKQLGVFDYSSNKFIPEEFAIKLGKGKINGYELLLYKDGGKPGTFIPHFSMFGEGFPYEECYINEHVFKLDFGNKGLNEFAYFYFNTDYVKSWLANNGGKAAIPGINQNNVNEIWIYDLENPKVKEFGKIVEPLFKQIFSNCKQNKELASIRDTLLPKLMNGEIEV